MALRGVPAAVPSTAMIVVAAVWADALGTLL
jgi:hypothetical protein